ncbi:hypothetical protein G7K_0140-t1 [Saitoella complicata NRRL Y-17804]|uniref:Uncharacterized protein n=1 Tax=Saitoella complicata (strain BCRC 22490 / CBS 7301 / JCM 7358 / NBRC 10748 / NRRL Y-17804) TaxID=698492 RepID=A0A0E9N7U5_SAICN|nr:hypothetical protein G7K_0140-t1 [Saitoella complicata NRRL Y-17804]
MIKRVRRLNLPFHVGWWAERRREDSVQGSARDRNKVTEVECRRFCERVVIEVITSSKSAGGREIADHFRDWNVKKLVKAMIEQASSHPGLPVIEATQRGAPSRKNPKDPFE